MRSEHLHLDLDSHDDYSFGTVVLGKDWDARRKVNRRREIQDDGTFLDYHVEFDEETFMSWFRLNEIRLPLRRLRGGVSNYWLS